METNNTILNQTNPVYNTAKLTLSILGSAGVPEAVVFADKLGFTEIRKEFDVHEKANSELPQAILQESRYEFLNRCVRKSNCKNVVDIACGFSPRGYALAKEGYNYLGLDLEASVGALNTIAKELQNENLPGSFRYEACDLTNPILFEKILDSIQGEVIIICEGLMPYLRYFEVKAVFEGIRSVLAKHGGKFYIADFMFTDIYIGVHISLLGKFKGMRALLKMARTTGKKSDIKWDDALIERNGSPKARELAKNIGLDIEMVPYFTEDESLNVWKLLNEKKFNKVKKSLLKTEGWSMTANTSFKNNDTSANAEARFEKQYKIEDDILKVKVIGRIDSTTSTEFLSSFNEAKDAAPYSKIQIDMSELQYISSAGLRVLMIMKKTLEEDKKISCLGVQDIVKDIFATTGYYSIVEIL